MCPTLPQKEQAIDAFLGPEIGPRECGEGVWLPEGVVVDVGALRRVGDAPERVEMVSQAWGACVRDCEAIDVDLSAGEGIEVDIDRKMSEKS